MPVPPQETARLLIRPYRADDLHARHALMNEAFGEETLEDTQIWLAWTLKNYDALERLYQPPYGDYAVVLRSTQEVIGTVGLVPSVVPWGVFETPAQPERLTPEFGLFWAVRSAWQGQGYATEAAQGLVQWLRQSFGVARLVATTERTNHSSQAVMRKLGMTLRENPHDAPFWFEVIGVLDNP